MRLREGRGWMLRTGLDGPWSGWLSVRDLDAVISVREGGWLALPALAEVARAFPGGLGLVWDAPRAWMECVPAEARPAFLAALSTVPGLGLHIEDPGFAAWVDRPLPLWLHAPDIPREEVGRAWRQGWLGWVPTPAPAWRLPGLGLAEGSGALWGEMALPVGALSELEPAEVARVLSEAQAQLERGFSQRLSVGAWPGAFPFHRKRCGWRIALVGGREFAAAGGAWPEAAASLSALAQRVTDALRVPVSLGPCGDPEVASLLGHQAMREGLPWRYSLALPPASPTFTPGLAADPREPSPLEARTRFPHALQALLADPPVAHLRVPAVPMEASVTAFLRGQDPLPALRWLPPEVPPPGPFAAECPWAPASAFTPLLDITQALPQGLFEGLDDA